MDKQPEEKLVVKTKRYRGKSAIVSARLPQDLVDTLESIASQTGRTRNEIIQLCLEYAVDNLEIKKG